MRACLSLSKFKRLSPSIITKMSNRDCPSQPVIYPAAERNKGPILAVLQSVFAQSERPVVKVLEAGSASGQHIAHFAAAFPTIQFTPSDVNGDLFANIRLLRDQQKLTNLQEPILLDLTWPADRWPQMCQLSSRPDVIYASNVLHISPWKVSEGLFAGAGRLLPSSGLLILYGPFAVNGVLSPESNVQFDQSLRGRDPSWGIRDLANLSCLAMDNGLHLLNTYEMPANNKVVVFQKDRAADAEREEN